MEAERAAIAAEIHDGLLPYLFAAAAKLASLSKAEGVEEGPFADGLADAARWVDESRQVARNLMQGISYPPMAVEAPLHAAADFLEDVLDLSSMTSPPVILWPWDRVSQSDNADRPTSTAIPALPREVAIAIYRLTIEFVRNAVRHAGAQQIEVVFEQRAERATVQILDDGCGFDPQAVTTEHLHGLTLARYRAMAAGIEMEIESSPSPGADRATGTRITLRHFIKNPG